MQIETKIKKKENKISLLIQGPINANSFLAIKFYQETFDDIIYSTYLDENNYLIKNFNCEKIKFVYSNKNEKNIINPSNVFFQALTTLKGIENCQHDFIIKIRSDELYINIKNIIEHINYNKINFSNVFFRHFSFYPYHISDHIIAGNKNILKKSFSDIVFYCKEKNSTSLFDANPYKGLGQDYLINLTPEQIISIFLLKNLDEKLNIDLHDTKQNIELFHKYFNIINIEKLRPYLISMRNENKQGRVYYSEYQKTLHYNYFDCDSIEEYVLLDHSKVYRSNSSKF